MNTTRSDGSRQAKPTPADKAAALRLRALWDAAVARSRAQPREQRLTQRVVADRLGIEQSAVSQFLNGKIKLNYRALVVFADVLGVDPREIRDDLPEQQVLTPANDDRPDPQALEDLGIAMLAIFEQLSGTMPGVASELAARIESATGEAASLSPDRLASRLLAALRDTAGRKPGQPSREPTPHGHASAVDRRGQA